MEAYLEFFVINEVEEFLRLVAAQENAMQNTTTW